MTEFFFINDLILYGIHHNELYIDMRRLSRPNPCVSSLRAKIGLYKIRGYPHYPSATSVDFKHYSLPPPPNHPIPKPF
jgi:hypothetical protein